LRFCGYGCIASRKGRCIPLILCHKKGVFRFAQIAGLTASGIGTLLPECDF
jgi:hypothetical protein